MNIPGLIAIALLLNFKLWLADAKKKSNFCSFATNCEVSNITLQHKNCCAKFPNQTLYSHKHSCRPLTQICTNKERYDPCADVCRACPGGWSNPNYTLHCNERDGVHHGGADEVIAHNNKTSPNDDPVNANSTGHLHHILINSSDAAAGNNLTTYTPAPRPPENSLEPLTTAANDIKNNSTPAPEDVPTSSPGSTRWSILGIFIVTATVVIVILLLIWFWCKRRRTSQFSAAQIAYKAGDKNARGNSAESPPEYQPMDRV